MLKVFVCEKCGTNVSADPDTEAKEDVLIRKYSKGAVVQTEIRCDVCNEVLYRTLEVDGTPHVVVSCCEGDPVDDSVEVEQIGNTIVARAKPPKATPPVAG